MSNFVHLHLHSEYSLLDGACRISEIPKRAKECGQTSVALTDHGVLYGAIAFDAACRAENIKPIIGCEVYVAPGSRFDKQQSVEGNAFHLVLLCENNVGYKNLSKLVSLGFTEGFYSRPRVDEELLRKYHEGLIALSACVSGRIPKELAKGNYQEAENIALRYSEIFGKNNFFIEIQDHDLTVEYEVLPRLVALARKCKIPLVATNDCHYLRKSDAETQAVLKCIQTNTTLSEGRNAAFATDEFYMKSSEEMSVLFSEYPEAISNTVEISERCNVTFDFSHIYLPKFDCPSGEDAATYLYKIAFEGLDKKIQNHEITLEKHTRKEYTERLDYELSVIFQMGYEDYFLIVQDYVNYASSHKIYVGPGRGSGAGSLAAYTLGITNIDPLCYDLLFERFLNPERVSMPDIDIDFCDNRRDEAVKYVVEKYGRDRVSQVITFGTLAARAAIRDVGRILDIPYGTVDTVAKAIPRELKITLDDALKTKELSTLYEEDMQVRRMIDIARKLEGMPRNVSIHAAGVVITDKPVTDYVPVSMSGDAVITQYDKDTIAHLGLLKFDFLGISNITILRNAEKMIKETDKTFDVGKIPLDDKETFQLISTGKTSGMFQLESAGMRATLQKMQPEHIDDIIAVIALYRPGPMDSIQRFIDSRHNKQAITYDIPQLEPILKSTYGCIVYQEQVMQIFRDLAGYSYGHADIVRRAMSKKKKEDILSERDNFIKGCVERNILQEKAEKLFDDMQSFANYAFNKSHAAAYAVLSYQTAYLKCHYPCEYFASLLTSDLSNKTKVCSYISECNAIGIRVLPPDINTSRKEFEKEKNCIRFGMLAIKGVGESFLNSMLNERDSGGKFKSFENFVERMPNRDLNKKMLESLIKAGAFDSLIPNRATLLASYEGIVDSVVKNSANDVDGQIDMFSMGSMIDAPSFHYNEMPELPLKEKLIMEKEATGLYFSGNLLDDYSHHIANIKQNSFEEIEDEDNPIADKTNVTLVGMVNSLVVKATKNGSRMASFVLEGYDGDIECLMFPRQFEKNINKIYSEACVVLNGTINTKEDERPKVIVDTLDLLIDNEHYIVKEPTKAKHQKLYLRFSSKNDEKMVRVNTLCEQNRGEIELFYYFTDEKKYVKLDMNVCEENQFIESLQGILGRENVILR